MCREVAGHEGERAIEVGDAPDCAALPAIGNVGRFGDASLKPQLHIGRKLVECASERLPIRGQSGGVLRSGGGRNLPCPNLDVPAVMRGKPRGQGLRPFKRAPGAGRLIQLGLGNAQTDPRQDQVWIAPQRLVE